MPKDEGSMMGSGIYAKDWTGEIECPTCDKSFEVEGQTNDWGTTVYAECPQCSGDLEKDISPDEFDYDDTYDND
jgi:Zn finger protein HypA/HybF involved in hydrogenase expression